MKFYWESFKTFFKIGAFTLGGGYAMIPIIESEVVEKRKWIGKEEFLDLIAIAQSCPGVFAINISVFIGYKLRKIRARSARPSARPCPRFSSFCSSPCSSIASWRWVGSQPCSEASVRPWWP